jgi:hypothetical protein
MVTFQAYSRLMRDIVKRAKSSMIEIAGSHTVFASQPENVADLVEEAVKPSEH